MDKIYISNENIYEMGRIGLKIVEKDNVLQILNEVTGKVKVEIILLDQDDEEPIVILTETTHNDWCKEVCGIGVTNNCMLIYYHSKNKEEMQKICVPLK